MRTEDQYKDRVISAAATARRGRLHAYGAVCLAIFAAVLIGLILKWPYINQTEIVARIIVALVLGTGGAVLLWLGYRNG